MVTINFCRMRYLIRETAKLEWRIEREKSRAERSTSSPHGVQGDRMRYSRVEDGAIRIAELKEAYKEALEELEEARNTLGPLIDRELQDADDRAVMRLRYMRGYKPEEIAEAVFRTERMIYYILSRCEKTMAKKLYPKVTEN